MKGLVEDIFALLIFNKGDIDPLLLRVIIPCVYDKLQVG